MNIEEWQKTLSGRKSGSEITPQEEELLKEDGIVYIYGYSDDCVEICGAYDNEVPVYDIETLGSNGNNFTASKDGNIIYGTEIDVEFSGEWTFHTKLPHKTVTVYEDNEIFCTGLLIYKKSIDKCAALNTIKSIQKALTVLTEYMEENDD
ncbi:MAG: hypothetical protein NC124_02085 [Clostridium sp.]|nr:hypothetical protein [Clostridium sp.]